MRGWVLFGLAAVACGGPAQALKGPEAPAGGKAELVTMITPARLVPEIDTRHNVAWFSEPGRDHYLLGGLRILVHDGGDVERADQRFPGGGVNALPLPDRLGGGFVFYQSDSQGTRLWRADTWIGKLQPLGLIGAPTEEVVAGFDRLYLRTRVNRLMALDPETGKLTRLGQLPSAPRLGVMVFADGWRGIVDTDLRGPMATFDAGATWSPLGIEEPLHNAVVVDGDPVLYAASGSYRLDATGHLQFVGYDAAALDAGAEDEEEDAEPKKKEHPLGDHPLRVAIERGWPDTRSSAVVLYHGKLVRVSLPGADVVAQAKTDLGEDVECKGARVGAGLGFICGEEQGTTTVYAFRSMTLAKVVSFDKPRFISPSGNGSLVARGKCEGEGGDAKDMRTYCIIGADGSQREIAVRGEVGAERVVALEDGRVVVLVPPRFGRPGRLTIIDGDSVKGVDLKYPEEPKRSVKVARRGLWLEGFEQHGKDAIAGWVEAGGPAVGVTVELDGDVKPGKVYDEGGQLLVAGRFALATSDAETGFESTDGGNTWLEIELPKLPESPSDEKTRACSPIGCAMRNWLRVGWGKPAAPDDLAAVANPDGIAVESKLRSSVSFACQLSGVPGKPLEHVSMGERAPFSAWPPFRDKAPPVLGKDDIGVDKASQYYDDIATQVYAWGPKGADWTRTGWWEIRFDDPFVHENSARQSAPTRSPWSDETTAAEAIGARYYGSYWRWEAALDPAGKAALVSLCAGTQCNHYGVSDGRPILELKPQSPNTYNYLHPVPNGVVRVGETWFLLIESHPGGPLTMWRADLGVLREATSFRRLFERSYPGQVLTPSLVRRALGGEIGLMYVEPPDPATGDQVGEWVVLPIDPATNELGSPVSLGPADLGGKAPRLCQEHDDGWTIDTRLHVPPSIDLTGTGGYVDDVQLRLRLEPGSACVVAMSAKVGGAIDSVDAKQIKPATAGFDVPLSVRERYTQRSWAFRCSGL